MAGATDPTSDAVYDGTNALTVTAGALGSAAGQRCTEMTVQNDPANTVNILIGNATSQSTVLRPGESGTIRVQNVNLVYAKTASSTATANWSARA